MGNAIAIDGLQLTVTQCLAPITYVVKNVGPCPGPNAECVPCCGTRRTALFVLLLAIHVHSHLGCRLDESNVVPLASLERFGGSADVRMVEAYGLNITSLCRHMVTGVAIHTVTSTGCIVKVQAGRAACTRRIRGEPKGVGELGGLLSRGNSDLFVCDHMQPF